MLIVMLENVSKIDLTSTLVASMEQVLEGRPPFAFSLVYPQNQIQTDVRYNLRIIKCSRSIRKTSSTSKCNLRQSI
jgi:uncharacterized lipoprotein YbaY